MLQSTFISLVRCVKEKLPKIQIQRLSNSCDINYNSVKLR